LLLAAAFAAGSGDFAHHRADRRVTTVAIDLGTDPDGDGGTNWAWDDFE
jgi:hypothetical protein